MRKLLAFGLGLLLAAPALAQQMSKPTDSQILGGRSTMFEGEARYFALWSQRLQADLAEAEAARKAEQEYWKAYVQGIGAKAAEGAAH